MDEIYKLAMPFIQKHKREGEVSRYYATISDLEFSLLIGSKKVDDDVQQLLDNLRPTSNLVESTIKQMRWFLEVLEKFSRRDIFLDEFVRVVELLEGYRDAK